MEPIETAVKIKNTEVLKEAWELFKKNFWFIIGVQIIVFSLPNLIDLISSLALPDSSVTESSFALGITFAIGIATYLFSLILIMGAVVVLLKVIRGEETSFSEIFSVYSPHMVLKYLAASILLSFAVLAGFIVLIIPSIIIGLMFMFALYLIVDKKTGIMESFSISKKMTSGYKMQLFLFLLALVGINILGLLCLGVGLIVTAAFSTFALIYMYNKLLEKNNLATPVTPISSSTSTTPETPVVVEAEMV